MAVWARQNLTEAQEEQRSRYDQKVTPRSFQAGDKVLLLLPTSENKLLAKWQGPYVVAKKIGEVDCEVETPDRRKESKVFHVNLLKPWKERKQEVYMGEDLGPSFGTMQREKGKKGGA